ncbi:ATP-dependent zinc metalloprotease FTSH 10 [Durusdinium trenchii]|uniref:Mitochondrial n=1 Tax=Durusdinium trenchii TaxID=1381693 RepID=A0ABP0RRL0_9DINO
MGSAASIVRAPIHGASVDEVTKIFEELHEPDRKKLLSAMAASQSQRARYGGEYLIHWDTTRGFEGKFSGDEFVAHDGDRRAVSKSEIYKLGEEWKCDDRMWAYWTKDNKYLNSGKVTAVGAEKSYVEFDDGDKGPVPNGWIHKMVRIGSGTARYGGEYLIHWDTTRGFEGKFSGDEFVAHDGDRRAVSKSEIYKLGEEWKCDDRVWAYWTKDNKYLNSGKVTAVGAEKSYVEFDDKDKGPIPNGWIHKMVKHETDNGNESNLSNNNS